MFEIPSQERLNFGTNIDVVTYLDGKRETHNPPGRAYSSTVWDHYQVIEIIQKWYWEVTDWGLEQYLIIINYNLIFISC